VRLFFCPFINVRLLTNIPFTRYPTPINKVPALYTIYISVLDGLLSRNTAPGLKEIPTLYLQDMARSQNSFLKKQLQQSKLQKRKEKEERKQQRHEHAAGGNLENMLAYVDADGNIISSPPEQQPDSASPDKENNSAVK
jgi:hypothetical protein